MPNKPSAEIPPSALTLLALTLLAFVTSGCSPVFTRVQPASGGTCDVIQLERHPNRRHRCGNLEVTLDSRPVTGACIEGAGNHACDPPRGAADGDLVFTIPSSWPAGPGTLNVQQTTSGTGCVLLGAFPTRRSGYDFPFTVTEQLARPVIDFSADPENIDPGDSTTLTWEVSGMTTGIRLDSTPVAATGSRTVSPATTQTYRLSASNSCLNASRGREVCVRPAQSRPRITGVDRACPGSSVAVRGSNLSYEPCGEANESSVIFAQSGRPFSPIPDVSPSATRLDVTLPSSLRPGNATAVARVGGMESAPFSFMVSGRRDGTFREVMLRQSGPHSCSRTGVTAATLSVASTGSCGTSTELCRTATFRQGTRVLRTVTFAIGGIRSGAAISPDCRYGVIVGQNTARTDDTYTLTIYDLASPLTARFNDPALGPDVQVLFSRDDSVMLFKAQDNFTSEADDATIGLFDLQRGRAVAGTPIPAVTCPTNCSQITANLSGCNLVSITFSGRTLTGPGPDRMSFPVE